MVKKILITGASGFIGKNLKEAFSSGYNLLRPSHKKLDLLDTKKVYQYLVANKPDCIIHTSFIGVSRNFKTKGNIIYPNLRMFLNLLKGEKFFKKMILLGSGAEYDKSRSLIKVKEKEFGQSIPQDQYGFSKYLCSLLIENKPKIINLRLFGIFGKGEDYKTRFISNTICKMLFGLPITIKKNVFFDYLYVDDLVKIIDYFVNHKPEYNFYNIGRGKSVDLITLAKIILKTGKKKLPINIFKKGLNKEYTCDINRLKSEIPQFKYTDFEESIKKLINYYQSILPEIKKADLYEKNAI